LLDDEYEKMKINFKFKLLFYFNSKTIENQRNSRSLKRLEEVNTQMCLKQLKFVAKGK
jgi:hypothetical protein